MFSSCFVSCVASLPSLLWHPQRVWLLHFWVFWKIRGCTMLTPLKETPECRICTSERKGHLKRKPQCKSRPGLLCGSLLRHHAWRWDREMKNEIPVTLSFLRRLRMERDGRLMTCVIMTNTASAAERSVHKKNGYRVQIRRLWRPVCGRGLRRWERCRVMIVNRCCICLSHSRNRCWDGDFSSKFL